MISVESRNVCTYLYKTMLLIKFATKLQDCLYRLVFEKMALKSNL